MSITYLHALPQAVITLSYDGNILYANAPAEALLGTSAASLEGAPASQFIHPYAELQNLISHALSHNTPVREFDFVLSGPKFRAIHTRLHIIPLDNASSAMLVIEDKSLELKLSQHKASREQSKSSSHMASILAHEVKNPLSGIRGAAQLLHATVTNEDQQLTTLICAEVDRIRSVIQEMEILSNPAELTMQAINIHEVLDYVRVLVETGTANNCRFVLHYDPSLPFVKGNRNLLIQLFLNLIGNAAEALQGTDDAVITLTTTYESGFRLKSENAAESHSVPIVVTVSDNGPGVAPALRDHIFEPFVTSRESGKGLGLAVVAKIVSDHGGVVELDSEHAPGGCFRVRLPVG